MLRNKLIARLSVVTWAIDGAAITGPALVAERTYHNTSRGVTTDEYQEQVMQGLISDRILIPDPEASLNDHALYGLNSGVHALLAPGVEKLFMGSKSSARTACIGTVYSVKDRSQKSK